MAKRALIVWGGWKGHTPKECAEFFAPILQKEGFEVIVSDTLDSFLDEDLMKSLSLVSPMWTMGQLTKPQEKGLLEAVSGGVGIGGFHGGMGDAFRNNPQYQWMVGGQWVAHPGGKLPEYQVNIVDHEHEITQGVADFTMRDTEQYYLHVDPSNNVLATTTFAQSGCVMPVIWTRMWGKGRVFYSSLGHTDKDFDVPECLETTLRGMKWASR